MLNIIIWFIFIRRGTFSSILSFYDKRWWKTHPLLKDGGLEIMCVMNLEKNVRYGQLSFISKDIHNLFSKFHSAEAKNVWIYQDSWIEESNLSILTLEDERMVGHIFWSCVQCFIWYKLFGDVVVFDTTYKINTYDMSVGIFVDRQSWYNYIIWMCSSA